MNRNKLTILVVATALAIFSVGCATETSNANKTATTSANTANVANTTTGTTNSNMTEKRSETAMKQESAPTGAKKIFTAKNGEQFTLVETPSNVATIISSLSAGKGENFKIERSQIPAKQLEELDKFAAETSGVAECKTNYVNGCNSCCADGVSGSFRSTTCGNFCDKVCGGQKCY